MMYVSHYLLTLRDCRALRLTDGYSLHRAVYGLFPDVRRGAEGRSGFLYADKGGKNGVRRGCIRRLDKNRPAMYTKQAGGSFVDPP